jgi:hypothetical protein
MHKYVKEKKKSWQVDESSEYIWGGFLKKLSWGVAKSSSAAWVVPLLKMFLNLAQTS